MIRRNLPILLVLASTLAACNDVTLVGGLGLIENNNYKTGGRSISGWAMSQVSEEDCEPMRAFESKPICRPRPARPEPSHCYRTLAAVTCYDQPHRAMPPSRYLPAPGQ